MENGNESAYPAQYINEQRSNMAGFSVYDTSSGLTKREYFAAMAMQGILANSNVHPCVATPFEEVVYTATKVADALLAELDKTKKDNGSKLDFS